MRFTIPRIALAAALALVVVVPVAGGATAAKPIIGAAVGTPAKPIAGERFAVAVKVTGATSAAVTPKAAGKAIPHTSSFRAGTARAGFVVPAAARSLQVVVTARSGVDVATKTFTLPVLPAPKPVLSVGDVTVNEGNAGTTTMSFPVTLSKASKQAVSVSYATANGTATTPADYAAANGTLSFAPGETSKTVAVSVVADVAIETDETLSLALSAPVNATLGQSSATGTIKNEDTQVPVQPGSYKGQLPSGDFLYFEVTQARQVNYFRVNDVRENCSPGGYFEGGVSYPRDAFWPISDAGLAGAASVWTGTEDLGGGFVYTHYEYRTTVKFDGSATVTGTLLLADEFDYGSHFSCTTGTMPWTATKIG